MRELLALIIGYALGSVLPAYFLGLAHGVDIRTQGSGNAGSQNALHTLGRGPGIVTALYDVTKGVVAVGLAWRLGVSETFMYAAGLAAVFGHRYPFYLGFRGARGLAVNVGLGYLYTGIALYRGWLPWPWFFAIVIGYLVLLATIRTGAAAQLIVLPILYAAVMLHDPSPVFGAFFGVVLAFIWFLHFTALRSRSQGPVTRFHLPRDA